MIKEHISYSELKIWKSCPFSHKLLYVDKIGKNRETIHTIAGTSIHKVCELLLKREIKENELKENIKKIFKENCESSGIAITETDYKQFEEQLSNIIEQYLPSLKKYFGEDFEFLAAEEPLMETIQEVKFKIKTFKGFIDLVLKTSDGKIHIIDNKLCSWGWDAKKKGDPMTTYQLTFYKHFYAQKHNIDPANIETHFALLKRTAKRDNIEIFRVTSGQIKTKNAFKVLNNGLISIEKGFFPKNRTSCTYCEFYKTENCK